MKAPENRLIKSGRDIAGSILCMKRTERMDVYYERVHERFKLDMESVLECGR